MTIFATKILVCYSLRTILNNIVYYILYISKRKLYRFLFVRIHMKATASESIVKNVLFFVENYLLDKAVEGYGEDLNAYKIFLHDYLIKIRATSI